jgi:hypothetical protein
MAAGVLTSKLREPFRDEGINFCVDNQYLDIPQTISANSMKAQPLAATT